MYIYIHIYVCVLEYVYVYMYIQYIKRAYIASGKARQL